MTTSKLFLWVAIFMELLAGGAGFLFIHKIILEVPTLANMWLAAFTLLLMWFLAPLATYIQYRNDTDSNLYK